MTPPAQPHRPSTDTRQSMQAGCRPCTGAVSPSEDTLSQHTGTSSHQASLLVSAFAEFEPGALCMLSISTLPQTYHLSHFLLSIFERFILFYGCFVYMYVHACLVSLEVKTPGTGVTGRCELCGCWEPDLGLRHVLLAAELSLPVAQDVPELDILLSQPPTYRRMVLATPPGSFFTMGVFHQGGGLLLPG